MINYVIQVLKSSQWINRIIVVGYPEMKSELDPSVILLEAGESLADNLKIGIDYLNHREHVLVITSDIPMLNVEALEDFLTRCSELEGDIFYPIISQESNENTYPGTERTYFHLKRRYFHWRQCCADWIKCSGSLLRNDQSRVEFTEKTMAFSTVIRF